jgi:predicted homoserine dehydrogenase-like protein
VAECIAVAKRDLRAGETLDSIGECCYRGSIDRVEITRREKLLPLGLAKGCVLGRAVPRDQAIGFEDIDHQPESLLRQMRKIQDQLCT